MLVIKGGQSLPKPDVISTPSFGMNYILGGGLWSGRIHVLWGNTQAGKSTLALHTAALAQEQGYTVVVVDAEGTTTDEWLTHCGVDLDTRIVIRSTRLEDILKEILPMMRESEAKYFFIIDSINTVVMEAFYKNDDGTGAIGYQARSQGAFLQKVADLMIGNTNHVMVLISQMTMKAEGMYFKQSGKFGNAVDHWATNIIRLSASSAAKNVELDDDERINNRMVTWKIQKSKQGPVQGTKGDYWFSPDTAEIDKSREAFHLGVRNGVIGKGGKWYKWNGQQYNGEKAILEALTEEDYDQILHELTKVELDFDVEEVVRMDD
jgi:RecA/RadA recombinase